MNHFISNGNYKAILQALQLDSTEVLRRAKLPEDTLTHKTITMSEAGYYRFLQAISDSLNSEAPLLQLASKEQIETFSPPIFASWCSKNGEACIERLAAYKKLIGPMSWHIAKNNEELTVTMETGDSELQLPSILVQSDFSFLIGMLRRATKTSIHPVYLQVKDLPASHALSDIAGIPIQKGSSNSITFRLADLRLPFICFNPAMWSYFEPEMNKLWPSSQWTIPCPPESAVPWLRCCPAAITASKTSLKSSAFPNERCSVNSIRRKRPFKSSSAVPAKPSPFTTYAIPI